MSFSNTTTSSRRRLTTDRKSKTRASQRAVEKQPDMNIENANDNNKSRIWIPYNTYRKHRTNIPMQRIICCVSAKMFRIVLTISTAMAMMGISIGITVGIYNILLPPKPKPQYVTIERSNYEEAYKTGKDQWGKIVLGKRPFTETIKWKNSYRSSELEAYVIVKASALGYDRQIARYTHTYPSRRESKPSHRRHRASLYPALRQPNAKLLPIDYSDSVNTKDLPSGCDLWLNPDLTNQTIFDSLQSFRAELEAYEFAIMDWKWVPPKTQWTWTWTWNYDADTDTNTDTNTETNTDTTMETSPTVADIRDYLDVYNSNKEVICDSLEIHSEGLQAIFGTTSLSQLPSGTDNRGVLVEPFLPPLRHPEFCYDYDYHETAQQESNTNQQQTNDDKINKTNHHNFFLDTGYIVHDFAAMCKNNIYKQSKTVFVDIGKPFGFRNPNVPQDPPPSLALIRLYERFGFVFDHIYGYGVHPWEPSDALHEIQDDSHLKASYHDFNMGVDSDLQSYANPFKILLEAYHPDDFVVVKLTMDKNNINNKNNNYLSISLAHQLLSNELESASSSSSSGHTLADLIDVIYISHPVTMKEMAIPWNDSMRGASIKDSIDFFASLREHGIAAHYWI